MRKISIWDVDYYYKRSGFNADIMRISSFHKQRGDQVNFILNEYDMNRPYDLIYIFKDDDKLQSPPSKFFDKRSKVWGKGFRYISNWKIPDVILACRPDYTLYPDPVTKFERADMLQFFNDDGKLLGLTQNAENTRSNKKTLIVDRAFWKSDDESIIFALNQLIEVWNVAFLEPIWLSKVVRNKNIREVFMKLEFTQGTFFKFKNNLGDTIEDAMEVVDFLSELQEHAPTTFVGSVNFAPVTTNHYQDKDNAWYDFERCLKIINLGKEHGFELKIQPLENRLKTPYYTLFETLSSWTQNAYKLSLIEFIAQPVEKQFNCSLEEVYSDPIKWHNAVFYDMLQVLNARPNFIRNYAIKRWKDNDLEIDNFNLNYLKESKDDRPNR